MLRPHGNLTFLAAVPGNATSSAALGIRYLGTTGISTGLVAATAQIMLGAALWIAIGADEFVTSKARVTHFATTILGAVPGLATRTGYDWIASSAEKRAAAHAATHLVHFIRTSASKTQHSLAPRAKLQHALHVSFIDKHRAAFKAVPTGNDTFGTFTIDNVRAEGVAPADTRNRNGEFTPSLPLVIFGKQTAMCFPPSATETNSGSRADFPPH